MHQLQTKSNAPEFITLTASPEQSYRQASAIMPIKVLTNDLALPPPPMPSPSLPSEQAT